MYGLQEKALDGLRSKVACSIVQVYGPKDHVLCLLCFWCDSKVACIYLSYNEY